MADQFIVIAGPCVIENRDFALRHAEALKKITEGLPIQYYYKSSFDKSNRQTYTSFRGVGLERGLAILDEIKRTFGLEICTDLHDVAQVKPVSEVASVMQIPAYLCRQTDLIVNTALTGKITEIKRGQFMAPQQMQGAVGKVRATGNANCWLTERGYSFGYGDLVFDPRAIPIMKSFCSTVLYDATHSVQMPGGMGTGSGGQRQFIEPLARAAIAVGVSGIFAECHSNPDEAKSDAATQIPLNDFPDLLKRLLDLHSAVKSL